MAMRGTIRGYTRKDQRISEVELSITLNGKFYTTSDWSLSGFRIKRYFGPLRTDGTALITSIGRPDSDGHTVNIEVRVANVYRSSSELACEFTPLGDAGYEILEAILYRRDIK